jgi:hypothetical protein
MTTATEQPLTDEQWAALNFEPWTHTEDEWKPPSNKEWADAIALLPHVRIAWICMFQTKAELQAIVTNLGDDAGAEMIETIIESRKFFKTFVDVLGGAEVRLFAAAAAAFPAEEEART